MLRWIEANAHLDAADKSAFEERARLVYPVRSGIRIREIAHARGVDRNARAACAAIQLVDRHAQRLAAQVVQRNVHSADSESVTERRVRHLLPQQHALEWIAIDEQ